MTNIKDPTSEKASQSGFSIFASKLNQAQAAIAVIVMLGIGVANYYIFNYRLDDITEKYANLDLRLRKTEEINYELISKQLTDIQTSNIELKTKIIKTNERIDKVLEILLSTTNHSGK